MRYDLLSRCRSAAEVAEAAGTITRVLGFDLWAYCAKVVHGEGLGVTWSRHNLPSTLWTAYFKPPGKAPNISPALQQLLPVVWLDGQMPTVSLESNPRASRLRKAATDARVAGGISMPIHDLSGMIATLTVVSPQPVSRQGLEAASAHALLFSKHLHQACRKHVLEAQRNATHGALSPREVQCLTWASKGKTSWEIGCLLGISEHTAIFHLRNASAKLGAVSCQQAVALSIQLGLVTT